MLETILKCERGAFLFLNGYHNPFWDSFMWLYSGQVGWIPVILFFLFMLFYKSDWKESVLIVLSIVLIIVLCDQFSSSICKPYFMRFRPTYHPDFMDCVKTVNDYIGGQYGFISSHSTNALGFAMFSLLLFRYRWYSISILIWGTIMAYTRIYLGVHFISDVVPGIVAGMFFGYLVYILYVAVRRKLLKKTDNPSRIYSESRKKFMLYGLFFTILCMLVYSVFYAYI
jgi:undecaprenyl-diphosphatase